MRHRLAALLLLLFLPHAAAAREGEVVALLAGERVEWDVAPGDYWYVAAADPEGADLDESRLGFPAATAPAGEDGARPWTLGPTNSHGGLLRVEEGERPSVAVREGTARFVLARPDLHHGEGNGTVATARAAGTLAPGECRAYAFASSVFGRLGEGSVTAGPSTFVAAGPNLTLRFYDSTLALRQEGRDALVHAGDPEGADAPALLQACAPEEAAGPTDLVVLVRREAALDGSTRGTPAPGLAALLGAGAVAAARKARAGRRQD